MTTGYEHATDAEFWTEVASDLAITTPGALADYVHDEAQRRDAELAANSRRRTALYDTAIERETAANAALDPMDAELNADEAAEFDRLRDAYNERFAFLASQHAGTGETR